MYCWYVIQSKPGQVQKAQQELEAQGFETYLPMLECERLIRGKQVRRLEALFPGYLFIWLSEIESNWRPIRSTRGVAKLVSFGQQPATVPQSVIQEIRSSLALREEPEGRLKRDQAVQITDGPFRNLRALFDQYDSQQRVFVFLELLGKWQRISLEINQIKPFAT